MSELPWALLNQPTGMVGSCVRRTDTASAVLHPKWYGYGTTMGVGTVSALEAGNGRDAGSGADLDPECGYSNDYPTPTT